MNTSAVRSSAILAEWFEVMIREVIQLGFHYPRLRDVFTTCSMHIHGHNDMPCSAEGLHMGPLLVFIRRNGQAVLFCFVDCMQAIISHSVEGVFARQQIAAWVVDK